MDVELLLNLKFDVGMITKMELEWNHQCGSDVLRMPKCCFFPGFFYEVVPKFAPKYDIV